MTKWIKIIGITALVLVGGLFICSKWIMKEAFGPKYTTFEIKIDANRTLKCSETYNADMAAVFYDVDFTIEDKTDKTLKLGRGSFGDEHWAKDIHLHSIVDWLVLPVSDYSYAKILMTNKLSTQNKDTILSPLDLRYDSIWKTIYDEIPAWTYSGTSSVDSVANDKFYVTYEYRIGDNQPFKFYSQTLEYRLDTATANLTTIKVFERHEKNNSR
jgi:hypothetical protein